MRFAKATPKELSTLDSRLSTVAGVLVATAIASSPQLALGNPWDLYGFNPRARGMGGAHTVAPDDFTGTYYHPASLTIANDPSFGFGFLLSRPRLRIDFDKEPEIAELRPPGSD